LKKELLELMKCPQCGAVLIEKGSESLGCTKCDYSARMVQGIPLFTDVPATIEPWEKVERGPDKGTAWRKSNWKFLNGFVINCLLKRKFWMLAPVTAILRISLKDASIIRWI